MKISKSDLKHIVKECLVELLQEGLGGFASSTSSQVSYNNTVKRSPYVENVDRQKFVPAASLRNAIKAESGGNKVMESILADTAKTTLPNMLRNDSGTGNANLSQPLNRGVAEQIVASVDPKELFGEDVSSKWADLAFAAAPKR